MFIYTTSAFSYSFYNNSTLQESWTMETSTSPYWWVNSGGYLKMYDRRGHTNEGALPQSDYWRKEYANSDPMDTDNGYHPQNIFRLITREQWKNIQQEVYFKVTKDNLSPSPNRGGDNGLLLFSRYINSDNLYYTGIRVDGAAVIKKKQNGIYTTLAYIPGIYPGIYNRNTNPDLIPKNAWVGIRVVVKNNPNGSVNIKLYIDKNWNGVWKLAADVNDNYPITSKGYAGIRTDFMDVIFDNYNANEIV